MPNEPGAIVGAGLSGLIAAYAWPVVPIYEAALEPRAQHRALLRFRSDAVSRLTGIEFKPVLVRKAIWSGGAFRKPNIAIANQYSMKTLGRYEPDRSIWNIEPATRYIAPEDFYEQLIEQHKSRLCWNTRYDFKTNTAYWGGAYQQTLSPIISTVPMPVTIENIIGHKPKEEFRRAPITVQRYRIPDCNVYQTVYFPDPTMAVYRVSITGDLMIVESVGPAHGLVEDDWRHIICSAFGLSSRGRMDLIETTRQNYGKIVPLPDALRKHLLFRLTNEHHIYSLGRFATWRNILLDDVVDDIAVIKRLMRSGHPYDVARARA
jgi:hypothetical protein